MANPIIVVDDDPDFIELVESVLESVGFDVIGCPVSSRAVEFVKRYHPSLLFLDLHMPRPNGWEIIRSLRQDAEFRATPVLVVSAVDASDVYDNAALNSWEMAPVAMLSKPFEIDELVRRVQSLIGDPLSDSGVGSVTSAHCIRVQLAN